MVKVGDKVKIKAVRNGGDLAQVNNVVTVTGPIMAFGFMATTSSGEEVYVCYDFDNSCADYLAGSIVTNETQTEAERRGAKFGVMGVLKLEKKKCVYLSKSLVLPGYWEIDVEGKSERWHRKPSEILLDHEPKFVAWSEAPDELKYDARRVYYRGDPVKWIAKPEGALAEAVYVMSDGNIQLLTGCLTVKL